MQPRLLDRGQPPPPTPATRYRFPTFRRQRLANGVQLFVAPWNRAPIVHLLLITLGGSHFDPRGKAGLASLTASLLDEGTSRHSAMEIADRIESLGGSLSTQGDWDSLSGVVELLATSFDFGFELLVEVMTEASFPAAEIERLRHHRLAELRRRLSQPAVLAGDALSRLIYGNTVYAEPLLGTPTTIGTLTREDFLSHKQTHVSPPGAALVVVGDLDPDVVADAAARRLEIWRGPPPPPPPTINPPPVSGTRILLINRPAAPQTELRIGHACVSRTHPDLVALQVMNSLLGGKFTSRINLNLRERHGITYGAFSSIAQRLGPGPFAVGAAVATASTGLAVGEILDELRRLQEQPVSPQELEDTKSFISGVFPYSLQRADGLVTRLAELAVFGLPDDYFDSYIPQILQVQIEDVGRVARTHLAPDRVSIVAVGPADELRGQLARFGSVEVEDPLEEDIE